MSLATKVSIVQGFLWKHGIVHYAINSKDYDAHSQDIIMTTLSQLQERICVKFFQSSSHFNTTDNNKILYITNPDKRKTCSSNVYDFNKTVVDMAIGYKCLNPRDVASIVTDMLRAGIDSSEVNNDLIDGFYMEPTTSLISTKESNFINSHYKSECGLLTSNVPTGRRSMTMEESPQLSAANIKYYSEKIWPLGIVLYGVDGKLVNTEDFNALRRAMRSIEMSTCVVFQQVVLDDVLLPKSYLWFGEEGEDVPQFGFVAGKQSIKLSSMVVGAAGHTAHAINSLLRAMGVPMMSNRHDRDNYIIIHWGNVETGKEQYLEKDPEDAWVTHVPYDFNSVTHAPANYMCSRCELGQLTVEPIQDKLWQRTISMGHTAQLSEADIRLVNMLYGAQCTASIKK